MRRIETFHQGVGIGSRAGLFEKAPLYGDYTHEKATFEKEPFKDNDIPAVPNHKANMGIRIHGMVPGLIFSADYNYVGSSFLISDQANAFEKLDDYDTINLRISYERDSLKAFAGVNNVTDEQYSEYAVIGGAGRNFYPAAERNWVAGLQITF